LLPLLKSIHKSCSLKTFAGQTIGVDAYGWLHRGAVSCAVELAQDKPTTKFVDFAMGRVRMLIHFGVKPYLVFDGDYLPSKNSTERGRASRRREAKRTGLELLRMGKPSQAQLELQKAVDVTPEMARQLIEELKNAGVDYLVAPYEADSQMVYLEKKGIIQGILSEDSDLLVFGAKCLLTKLDQYGDCVVINRSDFTACREISLTGWSDAEFRQMAILSGCDYLPGIEKMGLKTAYRLIRKHKTVERVVRSVQFDGKMKVPAGYMEAFGQAEKTFLYQWVFCPITQSLINLTEPDEEIDVAALPYIGKHVEPSIATAVATGDLHPHTKQPIQLKPKYHRRNQLTRASTMQTPDRKNHHSIESFFKSKRTPLAELDPNSFAPSPSQQALLEQHPGLFSTQPAPTRLSLNRASTALPASAPQFSCRSVSDNWPVYSVNSPKRQRLCSDGTIDSTLHGSVLETATSKFFASPVDPSPLVGRGAASRKAKRAEFDLWSDDSIGLAMAELPDVVNNSVSKPAKKITVFSDETSVADDSQSTDATVSRTTSQSTCITVPTPNDSQDEHAEYSDIFLEGAVCTPIDEPSVFSAGLSAQISDLRARFSFESGAHRDKADADLRKAAVRTGSVPSTASRHLHDTPTIHRGLDEVAMSQTQTSSPSRVDKATLKTTEVGSTCDYVPESSPAAADGQDLHPPYESPRCLNKKTLAEEDHHKAECEIDDDAWLALESMPPALTVSNTASAYSRSTTIFATMLGRSPIKGSEDLLVPDSEGEEDATLEPKLDLTKFLFHGRS
ncbi:hypothetical protein LTR28_007818, partial [Elasticomyces elasticus]